MKTVFHYERGKGELTAYQLADQNKINHAVQNLLIHANNFDHYGEEIKFMCDRDLGDTHFMYGDKDEIYLCKKKEGTNPYIYHKALLPRELMNALNGMYRCAYYDSEICKKANDPFIFTDTDDLFADEKEVLASASKKLIMASTLNPYRIEQENVKMVLQILESIWVEQKGNYHIGTPQDLLEVFKQYDYPGTNVLAHYISINPNMKTINEFLPSLMIPSRDPRIQNERLILRQSMDTLSLTTEWLQFGKKVEDAKEKVRQLVK